MKNIKNIIFDLGGVIINLDILKTIDEFNKISPLRFEDVYTQANQTELFNLFDKGQLTPEEFFEGLRKEIRFDGHEDEMIFAWNAMLLNVPEKRLDVLVKAKQQYNTYLLSNTNEAHIAVFEKNLYREHGVKNFEDYFDKVYYSCRMNMRKPDQEIFEFVLKENDLIPSETIFIDDSIQHVKGAGACGINSYLLPKNMEVGDLLTELKLF